MDPDYGASESYRQGWMRTTTNKNVRIEKWADRFFVLRQDFVLHYFLKNTDKDPAGRIHLNEACKISEIRPDPNNKKGKYFIFSISWPEEHEGTDMKHDADFLKDDSDKSADKNGDRFMIDPYDSNVTMTINNTSSNNANYEQPPSTTATPRPTPTSSYKKEKKQRPRSIIRWRNTNEDKDEKKDNVKEKDEKGNHHTVAWYAAGSVVAGAFTAGIGLMAGMVLLGMRDNMDVNDNDESSRQLHLACESLHDAELWVQAIEIQLKILHDDVLGVTQLRPTGRRVRRGTGTVHYAAPPEVRMSEVEEWIGSSRWRVWSIREGLRLFEQSYYDDLPSSSGSGSGGHNGYDNSIGNAPSCLRVNIGVSGSATDVFMAVMNLPPACRTGTIKSIRIVEIINNDTDVVHVVLDPVFIYPTWSAPRDLCLMRYWRQSKTDGSYVICLDSTTHLDCSLLPGHVRADLHAVYLISTPKIGTHGDVYDDEQPECMLTFIAQMDPKGWIWKLFGYQHESLQKLMMHVLDIRDTLDLERFVQVQFDPSIERSVPKKKGTTDITPVAGTIGTTPPPLAPEYWANLDATTFRVRGKTYKHDKIKTLSAPAIFKLIAIDIFDVPEPTFNISSHPNNRVHLAHLRGEETWVFVMNIMIPGPPYISFVIYLEGDKKKIEEDSPFGRIARPFFFGNDDEFRNNRFKLVPKILDGNIILKMAVKDTPSLMGNNLKVHYFKGDNYFESDVDVGSSSVARNIVGLALGYSKTIVVDMGFCLQGNEEDELPEILMGGASCIRIDCGVAKKL